MLVQPEAALAFSIALLGGLAVPRECLLIRLLASSAVLVCQPEVVLAASIALLRGLAVPRECLSSDCSHPRPCSYANRVCGWLSRSGPARGLAEPRVMPRSYDRSHPSRWYAPEVVLAVSVALLRGLAEPRECLVRLPHPRPCWYANPRLCWP